MPMLAERRRKTKWTNLGRQALWKRDSGDATFGREMLEKMGWKVGQGLGANEQGIKEPLRIAFKNDNKGVGFKDNDNEWIQQQSEFDEFLSKLSSEKKEVSQDSQTHTFQSLEERSRLSKARVHYHKFTRGKDLSKYSKKDLGCILGRNEKESSEISGNMESCNENIGNEDKILITAGSMVDYFAKKMQSKKIKKDDSLNIMNHEIGASSLASRSKDEPEENVVESTMEFEEKKKKKSKKKKKERDEGDCNVAPCDEMDMENGDYKMICSSEGDKKSKKTKPVQEHYQSVSLDGSRDCESGTTETELVETQEKEEEIENVDESSMEFEEKKKKKSKKKKKEKDEGDCNVAPCDEMDMENGDYKMISSSEGDKKSKKTKPVQEHYQSVSLDGSRDCESGTTETESTGALKEQMENVSNTNLGGDEVLGEKVKKKRKKKENLVEQFDMENMEALNILEQKDGECEGTQEKGDSLTPAEGVEKKNKTSKRDRQVIIDKDDEGAWKEKIKRKKKCSEAENRFSYEDCETNESDLNPVSHTETSFKKEKENRKTKCESAEGNKQETRKDEKERIAGEDPLYYKGELLKKENSLKGTSRNKLLNLIYSTNIQQFSGSNLGRLSGYGVLSHH